MTNYRYLGYGVTNENGVAHLDHDADGEPIDHSYTGVGAGEIDVLASLDNPIVEGSIVSEIYEVLDCSFADMIDSVSNTKWWNNGGNIGISTNDGVKVLTTNTSACQYRPASEETTDSSKIVTFAPSLVCEIEITEITGNWVLQTYDGSVNQNPQINTTGKYKIVYDGSTAKYYKDNSDTPFSQKGGFNNLNVNIGLQCWSSGQTLKYKNFKIYPI